MGIEETPRQKKVAAAIQNELAAMLQESIRKHGDFQPCAFHHQSQRNHRYVFGQSLP